MTRLKQDTVSKGMYALVAIAVLPALFILLYSGFRTRSVALDEATQRLGVVLNIVSEIQHEKSRQSRHLLQMLADLPAVRTMDLPRCSEVFEQLLAYSPDVSNAALLDERGVLVAAGRPILNGLDLSDRTAFQDALRTRNFSAGEYVFSRIQKMPILQFSLPVLDDAGNIAGVLFAAHDLRQFHEYLKNIDLYPESRFLLIDRDGLILADRTWQKDTTRIGLRVVEDNWKRIEASREETGTFTGLRFDGKKSLFRFAKLRLRPDERPYMVVLVNVPLDVVLAGANRALAWNLGLLALAAGLALAAAKLLGRTFVGRHVEALQASEERYRQVVETAIEGVWTLDADGRTTFANETLAAMLGRGVEDVLGSRMEDYAVADEAAAESGAALIEGLCERTFKRKDGALLHALVSTRFVRDEQGAPAGSISMVSDITEHSRAASALEKSEAHLRRITDLAPDAIVLLDQDGRVRFWNPSAERIFGYSRDEALGRDLLEILAPGRYREAFRKGFPAFRTSGLGAVVGKTLDLVALRKDGREAPVSLSVSVFADQGKWCTLGILRDIAERKQAERSLVEAKQQAVAANAAKSVFLANMSHEIRTPLNGILGTLQLLETTNLDEEQREYVRNSLRAGRRLTRLLADILDLSKIEAGKLDLLQTTFAMADVRKSLFELFALAAKGKNLNLVFEVDPRLPAVLVGDQIRLRQVLFNLVGNAIKFTVRGEVRVEVMPLRTDSRADLHVLFIVSDTGIGIPDELVGAVFEPFSQADNSFSRRFQGAGLGLSIVRKLVELMNGSLAIDNSRDKGTAIYLSLPFKPADAPETSPERAGSGAGKSRQRRVLVAEDDEINRSACLRMLEKIGHAATPARNGVEALDLLTARDFDLVLLDIEMPVMGGLETLERIKAGQAGEAKRNIPVIAMTAYAMAGDRERFLESGVDGYLAKPVDMKTLAGLIESVEDKAS